MPCIAFAHDATQSGMGTASLTGASVLCVCLVAMFVSVVQVRDFEFSPDDGRIASLVIDALGIPALPVKLLGCSAVKIQLVQNITWNCITLGPGLEAYIQKLTTGLFDNAVNVLRVSQLLALHVMSSDMSHLHLKHAVCQQIYINVLQTAYKSCIPPLHSKHGLSMQVTAAVESTHSHSHQTCCQRHPPVMVAVRWLLLINNQHSVM